MCDLAGSLILFPEYYSKPLPSPAQQTSPLAWNTGLHPACGSESILAVNSPPGKYPIFWYPLVAQRARPDYSASRGSRGLHLSFVGCASNSLTPTDLTRETKELVLYLWILARLKYLGKSAELIPGRSGRHARSSSFCGQDEFCFRGPGFLGNLHVTITAARMLRGSRLRVGFPTHDTGGAFFPKNFAGIERFHHQKWVRETAQRVGLWTFSFSCVTRRRKRQCHATHFHS